MICRHLLLLLAFCVGVFLWHAEVAIAQTNDATAERKPWHVELSDDSADEPAKPSPTTGNQPARQTPAAQNADAEKASDDVSLITEEALPPEAEQPIRDATAGNQASEEIRQPADSNIGINSIDSDANPHVPMLPELHIASGDIAILRDADGKWGIDDISSPSLRDRFEPMKSPNMQLDPAKGPVWLRITVENPTPYGVARVFTTFESSIDRVVLYASNGDGTFDISEAGRLVPAGHQDTIYRFPAVSYTVSANSRRVIYINASSSSRTGMVLHTGETDEIRRRFLLDAILLGLFYGTLAAMLFYNLFLTIFVGMRSYIGYVIYLVMLGGCTFMIDGMDRLLTTWHLSSLEASTYGEIFGALALTALLEFSRRFMKLSDHMPRADKAYKVLIALAVATVPAVFFMPIFVFPLSLIHI